MWISPVISYTVIMNFIIARTCITINFLTKFCSLYLPVDTSPALCTPGVNIGASSTQLCPHAPTLSLLMRAGGHLEVVGGHRQEGIVDLGDSKGCIQRPLVVCTTSPTNAPPSPVTVWMTWTHHPHPHPPTLIPPPSPLPHILTTTIISTSNTTDHGLTHKIGVDDNP